MQGNKPMHLRVYQETFIEACLKALHEYGNTLGVAPTGSGKTVMLSAIVGRLLENNSGRALILAHRDELVAQNRSTFERWHPHLSTSVMDAKTKDWSGTVVFAMVPTLQRDTHLATMPRIDVLVIDEAHHSTAISYKRIIAKAKALNPNLKLLGVTATPMRGDKTSLREVYSNCSGYLTLKDLIADGYLALPRPFVIDVGVHNDLQKVDLIGGDYDMQAVSLIMNRRPVNEAILSHWRYYARDRQTIVFCSTIKHGEHTTSAFCEAGIKAAFVSGMMTRAQRSSIFAALKSHEIQVLVNVGVALEGFDEPTLSCVVLLRPCSQKTTLVQMIGRGLRASPGKDDCLILDFGASLLTHGTLDLLPDLSPPRVPQEKDQPSTKDCPSCSAQVPAHVSLCPFCQHSFSKAEKEATFNDFQMKEWNGWQRSRFVWKPIEGMQGATIARGLHHWAGIFPSAHGWHAIGGDERGISPLGKGTQTQAYLAANAWLEKAEPASIDPTLKRWHLLPPSPQQFKALPSQHFYDFGLNRYHAACLLTFQKHHDTLQGLIRAAS